VTTSTGLPTTSELKAGTYRSVIEARTALARAKFVNAWSAPGWPMKWVRDGEKLAVATAHYFDPFSHVCVSEKVKIVDYDEFVPPNVL
jgi:hypothetical protein